MIGTSLGHYKIIEQLGAGGMGEVYRARDPRLDRDVAIKVLPEDFATDPERMARFEREAKLLAQLNHSNIAGIYGLEDADGVRFIAMECVEGETLADRIARSGRIEVDEALDIALQIAEALEAAHENGVIHRDLKPANVIVTSEGKAKVLDFGLAKAYEADGSLSEISPDLSHSPTMMDATRSGMILGTAAYMSPEQARGKRVDKRTDIWAFGCVLYEMLTGQRAFGGETVSDTMAAILKEEPDFDGLPGGLDDGASQLLRRCLAKDPMLRLRDIGEARFLLGGGTEIVSTHAAVGAGARLTPRYLVATAAVAIVAVAVLSFIGGGLYRDARGSDEPPQNLPIATAVGAGIDYWYRPVLALSPDGRWLAYVAEVGGAPQLYVQDLVAGAPARLIPKSAWAEAPFFSPDSESVAFFQGPTLQTVLVDAGEPTERASVGVSHPGGAWADDGSMLVVPRFGGPVQRIDAGGAVTHTLEPGPEERFFYPATLPGGERFLVSVQTNSRRSVVVMGWDGSRTLVADGAYYGRYAATGHVLWMRGHELVAASFDLDTFTAGEQKVVARDVVGNRQEGFGEFGVADDGTIAYLEAEAGGEWLQLLRPGEPPETLNSEALDLAHLQLDVSPVGDLVAYSDRSLPPNIHLFDLARRSPAGPLVTSLNIDFNPLFSPDGTTVSYTGIREDYSWVFYETTPNAPGDPRELLASDAPKWAQGWSPDGEALIFMQENADAGTDVMLLPPAGAEPRVFVGTPAGELSPVFSADGNWIIYSSDETGRLETYARSYPAGDVREHVSIEGGRRVRVADDGSIFFNNGEIVMRVEVIDPDAMDTTPAVEFVRGVDSNAWDVLPDGSGVIAVQRRAWPQLRLILGAAELFPER